MCKTKGGGAGKRCHFLFRIIGTEKLKRTYANRQQVRFSGFYTLVFVSSSLQDIISIMEGWDDGGNKPKNTLPLYANKDSMNLNSMILTNIVGSAYFKEELFQYKTFHEVVDQIYYKASWYFYDS